METLSNRQLNELFVQKLNSADGIEKIAQEGGFFVRQKLREFSFTRKVLPPIYVTKADLQRSVNHDGLVKIVDIEPDSRAMVVNFRGYPENEYIVGERFEIPLFSISSREMQKTEEELLAYEMPFTEILEKNIVFDIHKIEDEKFISWVDAAVALEGNAITGNYETTGAETGAVKKNDLKRLFDLLDGKELLADTILMDKTMYNRLNIYTASNIGSQAGTEIFINGHTYSTLFGRKLIVSNKVSLLQNKIYAFTAPEFLGQFIVLNDSQFFIEKKRNLITFSAYETIGIGIGNTKACAKITLS